MKAKVLNYMIAGGLSLGMSGLALADHHLEPSNDAPKDEVKHFLNAETMTGKDVWDFHGNKLGTVHCVLIGATGKGVLVVVDTDDLIEADHKVAVPFSKIHVKHTDGEEKEVTFALDTTKEKLKGAPKYMLEDKDELFDYGLVRPVYQYWGVERMKRDKPAKKAPDAKAEAKVEKK